MKFPFRQNILNKGFAFNPVPSLVSSWKVDFILRARVLQGKPLCLLWYSDRSSAIQMTKIIVRAWPESPESPESPDPLAQWRWLDLHLYYLRLDFYCLDSWRESWNPTNGCLCKFLIKGCYPSFVNSCFILPLHCLAIIKSIHFKGNRNGLNHLRFDSKIDTIWRSFWNLHQRAVSNST